MFNRYSLFKPPKILTLILTMLIIFPTFPKNVAAATNVSVTYNFANSNPGFAEGSIKITAAQSMYGNYYIYWADSSAALSGYYEIDKINVTSAEQSISISKNVAIPVKASYLIAIKSDTEPTDKSVANATAVYALPDNKKSKNNTTNALYSFECLSDIHIDKQSSSFYTYAEEHFASALECAAQRKVDFVTTCGDEINNYNDMTSKEWQVYQKIIAESSYCNPIYETLGNHEMQSNVAYGHEAFRTATGLSANTEAVGDKSYYEMTASNGDHFIFMSLDNSSSPNNTDEFTTEQLDWLESLLGKYYNDGHKIFVYEHALFSKYGAGDSKTTPYYGGSLSFNYPSTVRFKGIIEKYKNIFLFSGHTHLALQYEYNYDNQNGTSANMIHIPSCACPTHIS